MRLLLTIPAILALAAAAVGPASTGGSASTRDTSSRTLISSPGLLSIQPMIAAGGVHTCSVNASGALRCWGANYNGQLGDGTTISHQRPALVAGLGSGVAAVAAGSAHTCALTTAGGVKCWGANADGELGDFTQVNRSTPVDVINLTSGVVAISSGDRHTCALLATGGMQCWGYNVYGELGNGTSGNSWLGAVDVCASGAGFGCAAGAPLTGIASMTAGGINTCAVTTVGALKCWGGNYNGQLGVGIAPDLPLPASGVCPTAVEPNASCISLPVDVIGLQSGIAAVNAGTTTCALTTAGGVKCWGNNGSGEVGNGTTALCNVFSGYCQPQLTPVDVTGLGSGVSAIAGSCAMLASGGVRCWGENTFGQVGDGTHAIRPSPVDVFGLSSGVASISRGGEQVHPCVVMAAGGLKCWGANGWGQLGAASTETCFIDTPCSTVPVDVSQCSICVEGIAFKHQVYPDNVNWVPVGAQGTVDGNQVRAIATLQNQTALSQPVTVEFRDADTDVLLPGGSIDGTVPASSALPVTLVWNTDGFAWNSGVAHSPRFVRVLILQGGTPQDFDIRSIKIVPKPVVLVHGYASSAGTWSAYQGFLSASSPDWKAYAVGDGAVPGREDTGALPPAARTNTIDENAQQVDLYIEGVRKLTNAWHVDIVAHSMGGLISRYYVQNVMGPDAYSKPVVSHLIMLGTPNHGTICADLIFVASGTLANFPATLQNTIAYVSAIFDTQVTNRRGVPFSISAGILPVGTCIVGLPPSDGITGLLSAVGVGGDASPLFGISDYETRFIGHTAMTSSKPTFDEFVKPRLVATPPPAAPAVLARNAAQASAAAAPASDTSPQLIGVNGLQLAAGGMVDLPFTVTDGTEIGVTMITAPAVSSELRDPNGVVVSAIAAGSAESMLPFRSLSASAPITGAWTLHLANTGSGTASVTTSAWVQGSAVLLTLGLGTPAPDGATPLTAAFTTSGAAITGAAVTVTLTGSDGPHGPTTLVDDGLHGDGAAGDGVYGGTTGSLSAGLYAVALQATASRVVRYTTGVIDTTVPPPAPTATPTFTATATATASGTPTPTNTPAPTATDTPTATNTAVATATDTATSTPTATPTPGGGATFIVNSTVDAVDAHPGDGSCATAANVCTLRAAIMEANARAGADTIILPAGTYVLPLGPPGVGPFQGLSGNLAITDALTIMGAGSDRTIIDGNGDITGNRVFYVLPSDSRVIINVRFTGVAITNGGGSTQDVGSGIFVAAGVLTLDSVRLSGNRAGAIYNLGVIAMNHSVVSNNAGVGGGIGNSDGATLTVDNSIISDNTAVGVGNNGTANITNSTLSGNQGGGIYNRVSGRLTVTSSTISGNVTEFNGGGISNGGGLGAVLSVTNSTVSGNRAAGNGGGIYNAASVFSTAGLNNVTIAGNTADAAGTGGSDGGGIYNFSSAAANQLKLHNTVVGANVDGGGEAPDCAGPLNSQGHNLIGATTGCIINGDATGNVTAQDPKLGPLADNGGPTMTRALLASSPAIDAGDNASCPAIDQRGIVRPIDGDGDGVATCDIGAFEAALAPAAPTATNTATATATTAAFTPTPTATATATNTSVPTATPTATATASSGCGPLVVNSTADSVDAAPGNCVCASAGGLCTLRAAIMEANASPGADTITLPAGTYTLTLTGPDEDLGATGDLDITDAVTIGGAGAASTIVNANAGNPRDRAFHIHGATGAPQVTISGVTITGGASTFGGGIFNDRASLVLTAVSLQGNSAGDTGGGIFNGNGNVTILQSTISGNGTSFNGDGGGIANAGASATLSMVNDTVSGNFAFIGGGVFNLGGHVSLTNTTVSGNAFTGGGQTGGLDNFGSGTIAVTNTLIGQNRGSCGGSITSGGHNFDADATCGLNSVGDVHPPINQLMDAMIGPLADNGGPTLTYALLLGSPAIDTGDAAVCPQVDQRGVTRPQDGDGDGIARCDIGAYEAQPGDTPTPTPAGIETDTPTATVTPTSTNTLTATATSTVVPSDTLTATNTSVPTSTSTPTATNTSVPTSTSTLTAANTSVPTSTNTPTATNTSVPTSTNTPTTTPTTTLTATQTATQTVTNTPVATSTSTFTPTATATPLPANTPTPTKTAVATATNTAMASRTAVRTSTAGATRTSVATRTPMATRTAVPTATPTPRSRRCGDRRRDDDGEVEEALQIVLAWLRHSHDSRYDMNDDGRIDLHDALSVFGKHRCDDERRVAHHADD